MLDVSAAISITKTCLQLFAVSYALKESFLLLTAQLQEWAGQN